MTGDRSEKARVALARAEAYDLETLKNRIRGCLEQLGRAEAFAGRRVLLKVNLNKGGPPEEAINTHPVFTRAVVQLVHEQGGRAAIGDSSAILGFSDAVFEVAGMGEVCRQEGAEAINFDAVTYACRRIDGEVLQEAFIPETLGEFDLLVSLPKLKIHDLTIYSGALKNHLGLLPGATKCGVHVRAPHPERLAAAVVDLNEAVPFDLAIVDGVVGLEAGETPRAGGLVAAGTDFLALDTVCARLVGLDPAEVPTLRIGRRRGLGEGDLERIEVVGETIEALAQRFESKDRELKRNPFIAKNVYRVRGSFLEVWMDRARCTECGRCVEVCPTEAVDLANFRIRKEACIRCFSCHHNCPEGAIPLRCPWYLKPLFKKKAKGIDLGAKLG